MGFREELVLSKDPKGIGGGRLVSGLLHYRDLLLVSGNGDWYDLRNPLCVWGEAQSDSYQKNRVTSLSGVLSHSPTIREWRRFSR